MSTPDYKNTVFLPRTDFPMRAGLPKLEPKLLDAWEKRALYQELRAVSKGREPFVLHDGPPYANGHLHIGHALNKILKDVIVRSQQMRGFDANYVPGWDCHGLPIEWKIEERYRKKGRDKDAVPIVEFRKECRDFADDWIGKQREEFKRLGIAGDWSNPYVTMDYAAEAAIVRELGKFLINGGLYKGEKPVMWSVVEKTALAEAEVEYHDHTSTTIWVRFPVEKAATPEIEGASVVIWTTTPWTMPGNRAVAHGAEIDYCVVEVTEVAEGSLAKVGEKIALAEALVDDVTGAAGITGHAVTARFKGAALDGTVLKHPLAAKGYDDFEVPMLAGDFVTTEQGTGFVHIAPGHGEDDFYLCRDNGVAGVQPVADDGVYYDFVPLFAGQHVYKVAPSVMEAMQAEGALLAHGQLVHSYPHSWRSKAPLIFRTTPQWFISMDANDLRVKALKAIDETTFVPAGGRNRIRSMVEGRPDWCVSRQRAWGVPITVFVNKRTGEPLRDETVLERIIAAVEEQGADAWFDGDPRRFLAPDHSPDDYEPVTDILDVWFDSGSTHAFVLEDRADLTWPAQLYLEGSDQHRGWFQSSLLESCGTRGRAPYEAVLTHGFVMDEQGRKMSKSLGNVVSPQQVVEQYGADILRLWVVSADYSEDLRIGPEILKQTADIYRRLRNTLRYLLGALQDFDAEAETLPVDQMPELERWVLHRLWRIDSDVRAACTTYEFHELFRSLHDFCAVDLSAFYFDIRKDALYCDAPDSPRRRATRTVMDRVFETLTRWLAPFVCFTAEEAFQTRHGSEKSVHLELFEGVPAAWRADDLAEKWKSVRQLRRVVTSALEKARAAKDIGASLQAAPVVHAPGDMIDALEGLDFATLCITSDIRLTTDPVPDGAYVLDDVPGVGVVMRKAEGEKCQRCWQVLPEVGQQSHAGLCKRCDDVVERLDLAPAGD